MVDTNPSGCAHGVRRTARGVAGMLGAALLALAPASAAPADADGDAQVMAAYRAPQPAAGSEVVVLDPAWRGHVRGRLVAHAGGILTLETPVGLLHFTAGSVECWGAACPPAGAAPG